MIAFPKERPLYYLLNADHSVTPIHGHPTREQHRLMAANRRVRHHTLVSIPWLMYEMRVSTVFLTIDHNHGFEGDPILFETMIFGGPHDQYQRRYRTWDEAVAGHRRAVLMAYLALLFWPIAYPLKWSEGLRWRIAWARRSRQAKKGGGGAENAEKPSR